MEKSSVEVQVAELWSVSYSKNDDDVFVTFKVISEEYKDTVLRMSKRDDIEIIIRGDKLSISMERET